MDSQEITQWPSEAPGVVTQWLEFTMDPDPKMKDTKGLPRRFRIDVSFLKSGYHCIWGKGCPSIGLTGFTPHTGCCQIGVHIEKSERKRVESYVNQLLPSECDNFEEIKRGRWFEEVEEEDDDGKPVKRIKTALKDGACVLLNRPGGSANSPGCSLHVLALKKDLHHSDTKPDVCWQMPIAVSLEEDDERGEMIITVSGTPASRWGSTDPNELEFPGWWCTDTPDAYESTNDVGTNFAPDLTADNPVYKSYEAELRKLMGSAAYVEMFKLLEQTPRMHRTAGEMANGGRTMIPLLVKQRTQRWMSEEGTHKWLDRSASFFHGGMGAMQGEGTKDADAD